MDIETRFSDGDGAEERLQRLVVFLQDLRSFWPMVVPVVTGWWRAQFASEGAFAGQPWAPLSPAYAQRKERDYPGRGILVRSGDMRRVASMPLRTQTPTTLTLTIDSPYLEYHQQQDGPVANLPRRPLVFGDPLPAAAQAELDTVAEEYVTDLLRRL